MHLCFFNHRNEDVKGLLSKLCVSRTPPCCSFVSLHSQKHTKLIMVWIVKPQKTWATLTTGTVGGTVLVMPDNKTWCHYGVFELLSHLMKRKPLWGLPHKQNNIGTMCNSLKHQSVKFSIGLVECIIVYESLRKSRVCR